MSNLVYSKQLKPMNLTTSTETNKIYTFGYGNRKNYDSLLTYLLKFDVKYIIDVRLSPRAWTRTWYGDKLESFCQSQNIHYISKTALGNTSGKANWIPPNKKQAQESLHELAEILQHSSLLLLCAEIDYKRCHRLEVAQSLSKITNVPVTHLA